MGFDSSWNVEKYKTEHESDEQWTLRRNFMLAHKNKFSEDRLVCLAQVFVNMECLGCRYPAKTMQLVAELSQGVADDFRKKQQTKLQRTFVKASDAAGAKVKGLKRPLETPPQPQEAREKSEIKQVKQVATMKNIPASSPLYSFKERTVSAEITLGPRIDQVPPKSAVNPSRYGGVRTYHINKDEETKKQQNTNSNNDAKHLQASPYGKLVIVETAAQYDSAHNTLHRSTSLCHVPLKVDQKGSSGRMICEVYINNILVAREQGISKKEANNIAMEAALNKLKKSCYTLKVKVKYVADQRVDKSSFESSKNKNNEVLGSDNIGHKLMRLMGWTGGGLGKDQQGIEEPVSVSETINRSGLGLSFSSSGNPGNMKIFRQKVRKLMLEYLHKDTYHDLVFSSDFSSEERKEMHQIACGLRLKTQSHGKDEDRHLVVSKKKDMWKVLEEVIQAGGSTERYDVIPPDEIQ